MNIAFLGSNNFFSSTLFRLFSQQLPLSSVILPGIKPPTRYATPSGMDLLTDFNTRLTTEHLAQQAHIPIEYQGGKKSSQLANYLVAQKIDILIVACYPYLIPQVVVSASTFGAINIHSSLLPTYRGPTPIFWQLRNNESHFGVSLHQVSKQFDAGKIIKQTEVDVATGDTCGQIETILTIAANDMLMDVLKSKKSLQANIADACMQDEEQSSYFGLPQTPKDFCIPLDWHAAHAFRFMRGTQQWQNAYTIILNGKKLLLSSAISYSVKPLPEITLYEKNDIVNVAFKTGYLRATYLV